jgi:alkyl hydroperoxide reductase subunit AhpF
MAMSDHTTKTANYCPQCGTELASAEAVAVDGDLTASGVFTQADAAHLVIEDGMIEVYTHAGGEA